MNILISVAVETLRASGEWHHRIDEQTRDAKCCSVDVSGRVQLFASDMNCISVFTN